jgi:hypothetical protein
VRIQRAAASVIVVVAIAQGIVAGNALFVALAAG